MTSINIKTEKEIEAIRESCKRLALVMEELEKNVLPGVSTKKIDSIAEKLILESDGTPSFKGYGDPKKPFPATICASINSEIVHGIPKEEVILKEGDIFKIDIGMKYRGMHSDMARTFAVGKIDKNKQELIITENFKLFSTKGNYSGYFPDSEVYYSDNSKLPKKIINQEPILNFPKRIGESERRNGLNHDGLQHETGDEHPGQGKTDRKAQNLEAEL
jgi:hypothetical protein